MPGCSRLHAYIARFLTPAGITTYSPLVYYGAKAKGAACTTGVIGFGGLGHMAVKLAKAMVSV